MHNDDGDIIITEEEFFEIQKLKDLKVTYRNYFDELKTLKTQVQYCQKLVDQCRQRLLNGEEALSLLQLLTFLNVRTLSVPALHSQICLQNPAPFG